MAQDGLVHQVLFPYGVHLHHEILCIRIDNAMATAMSRCTPVTGQLDLPDRVSILPSRFRAIRPILSVHERTVQTEAEYSDSFPPFVSTSDREKVRRCDF